MPETVQARGVRGFDEGAEVENLESGLILGCFEGRLSAFADSVDVGVERNRNQGWGH